MRTKRVNRYYCDFCKKSGCSAGHMRRHERHCTMNPKRTCGVCAMLDYPQTSLASLTGRLPDAKDYLVADEWGLECYKGSLTDAANNCLAIVREEANNCPACILAAIRQSGIPVLMVTDFNYTEERKAMWEIVNDARRRGELAEMRSEVGYHGCVR